MSRVEGIENHATYRVTEPTQRFGFHRVILVRSQIVSMTARRQRRLGFLPLGARRVPRPMSTDRSPVKKLASPAARALGLGARFQRVERDDGTMVTGRW